MATELWLGAGGAVFILINLGFILALWRRRNDFADIIWGPGFLVAALGLIFYKTQTLHEAWGNPRAYWAFGMIAVWALRLAGHIGLRNLTKKEEDPRYKKWRVEWGKTWVWRSYLQVFLLQGILILVVDSAALWIIESADQAMDVVTYLGIAVWIFGFVFESIGDRQLQAFKANKSNKGKLMDRGLWSWSRHPNYFGEVVQWWGLGLMAITTPGGWWTMISPVVITFLILKVSGIPMLEEGMKGRPGFAEYCRRTSIFFPRPPKK